MMTKEEICWIGLQEERGAPIRACTCHSFRDIDDIGVYLYGKYSSWQYEKDSGLVVKRLRTLIDMKDVIVGRWTRVLKDVAELIPVSNNQSNAGNPMEFEDYEAFYNAFIKTPGIDYAYLFAVPVDNAASGYKNRHEWAMLTKVPFSLYRLREGESYRFARLDF
nr:hypothetical protein [Candidatus Sigynarchaeota archaeon]